MVFVWGGVGADSVYGLTLDEIIWYQHHVQGHQYEKHLNTVSPRLKALRKRPSSRSLSPLDNCPDKAGRAYNVTTVLYLS